MSVSNELIMKKPKINKDYPNWVCNKCGREANRLTCLKKYGKEPIKIAFTCSTFHSGECDVCGEKTSVTEPRDFFYPDFTLLNKNL